MTSETERRLIWPSATPATSADVAQLIYLIYLLNKCLFHLYLNAVNLLQIFDIPVVTKSMQRYGVNVKLPPVLGVLQGVLCPARHLPRPPDFYVFRLPFPP